MIKKTLLILLLIILYLFYIINKNKKESFSDYQNCRSMGFTKEFCVMNPPFPNNCLCKDGTIGIILPGYKGECVCNKSSNILNPRFQ